MASVARVVTMPLTIYLDHVVSRCACRCPHSTSGGGTPSRLGFWYSGSLSYSSSLAY